MQPHVWQPIQTLNVCRERLCCGAGGARFELTERLSKSNCCWRSFIAIGKVKRHTIDRIHMTEVTEVLERTSTNLGARLHSLDGLPFSQGIILCIVKP
jgi:hypothetical protein